MTEPLKCWKCGAPLTHEPLPLSRRAECRQCRAEQHVCRMCMLFDARVSGQCVEERAEDVTDKVRANFCDYFKPNKSAFQPARDDRAAKARAALDGLFGDGGRAADSPSPSDAASDARRRLDDLFKP